MTKNLKQLSSLFFLGTTPFLLLACGQSFQPLQKFQVTADSIEVAPPSGASGSSAAALPAPPTPVIPAAPSVGNANGAASGVAPGPTDPTAQTFCSQLSFNGVTWDKSLDVSARRAFAIALSLSGGFEGGDGWSNITNNFDGTGLSAGLLNQTLGTGSLQPLLATMKNAHPAEFNGSMSVAHASALSSMLGAWEKSTSWSPSEVMQLNSEIMMESGAPVETLRGPASFAAPLAFTPLDTGFHILSTATTNSIQWAVQNLYLSSGAFVPSWKSDMQMLLKNPDYVTIQINAALHYHQLAQRYMMRVGYNDLRTYLLMFDIATQNGSISEQRFTQWQNLVASQKITGEVERLKALVDIRLLDTLPQWRADVRSRKYTIIDGTGVVHGSALNLPKKFCYSLKDSAN